MLPAHLALQTCDWDQAVLLLAQCHGRSEVDPGRVKGLVAALAESAAGAGGHAHGPPLGHPRGCAPPWVTSQGGHGVGEWPIFGVE
jgi:hypothetical protein